MKMQTAPVLLLQWIFYVSIQGRWSLFLDTGQVLHLHLHPPGSPLRPDPSGEARGFNLTLTNSTWEATFALHTARESVHAHFVSRTLEKNRTSMVVKQEVPPCWYFGRLYGLHHVTASFDACHNFRGKIHGDQSTWSLIPVGDNLGDGVELKLLPRQFVQLPVTSSCTEQRTVPPDLHHLRRSWKQSRRRRSSDTQLVELFLVFDTAMYTGPLGSDDQNAVDVATQIANHLDMFYKYDTEIRVVLVGMEVWKGSDPITMTTEPAQLLKRFITYSRKALRASFNFDIAALVSGLDFDGTLAGMAYVDVMCTPLSAAVVQFFPAHPDPPQKAALTLAHELGHALGLLHDTPACTCTHPSRTCIMAADTSKDPTVFSSCSVGALRALFASGGAGCLYDRPRAVFQGPVCGNALREAGELCDCGSVRECQGNPCCQSGCRLRAGAACDVGGCCSNCQILRSGVRCRAAQNDCDLEEFCDGTSPECPANLYLAELSDCGSGQLQGFCHQGRCRSAEAQCRYLWGPGAHKAQDMCFLGNADGDAFGNCGRQGGGGFIKCNSSDLLCGMLWCEATASAPQVGSASGIVHRSGCIGAAIDLGPDVPDPGLVGDGTPCRQPGPSPTEGVCLGARCLPLASLPRPPCPGPPGLPCSGHGVCTNTGTCWCKDGHTGNDCSQQGGVTRVRSTTTPQTTGTSGTQPTGPTVESTSIAGKQGGALPWGLVGGALAGGLCGVTVAMVTVVLVWRAKRRPKNDNSISLEPPQSLVGRDRLSQPPRAPRTAWGEGKSVSSSRGRVRGGARGTTVRRV